MRGSSTLADTFAIAPFMLGEHSVPLLLLAAPTTPSRGVVEDARPGNFQVNQL